MYAANQQADAAENAANLQSQTAQNSAQLQQQAAGVASGNLGQAAGVAGAQLQAGYQPSMDLIQTGAQQVANQQNQALSTIGSQYAPYTGLGASAAGQLQAGVNDGSLTRGFTTADLDANLSPAYAFQLEQGLGQAGAQLNAAGGLVSGNAMQGLNTFAQNYAQTAFQQAYNNYNQNQANAFTRLSTLANQGQTAAGAVGSAAQTAAGAIGGAQQAASSSQAALTSGLSSNLANLATGTAQTQGNYLTGGAGGAANALTAGAQNAGLYATQAAAAQAAGVVGASNAAQSGMNNYMGWNYLNSAGKSGSSSSALAEDAAGSDARIKSGMGEPESALDRLMQIRVVQHDWKDNAGAYAQRAGQIGHVDFSFVAQQLAEIMPGAVVPGDKGETPRTVWTVAPYQIIAALVKGLQEQQAQIVDLRDQLLGGR
jgi:hypothetical protein